VFAPLFQDASRPVHPADNIGVLSGKYLSSGVNVNTLDE
jgi:hypothetical protein